MRPLPETTAALRALDAVLIRSDGWMPDHARESLTLAVAKTVCGISPQLAQVELEGVTVATEAEKPNSATIPRGITAL